MTTLHKILLLLYAIALASCDTPPTVTKQPNVGAVIQQNKQTVQHIQKTKTHIQKSQDSEKRADDHLKAVSGDIDKLLDMPATITSTPIPSTTPSATVVLKPKKL